VCHLLGIESERTLARSPFVGAVFESFVASEFLKQQVNAGKRRALYYFRDEQGLEVDFVIPQGNKRLLLIEAKSSRTVTASEGASLSRLAQSIKNYDVTSIVVHRPTADDPRFSTLSKSIRAVSLKQALAFAR
jgi:predicted AAA+ superfamily ATPase